MKTTKTTSTVLLTIALACVAVIAAGCKPVHVVVGGGGPVAVPSPHPPHPPAGPGLHLVHPAPGQIWHLGHNYVIRWHAAGFIHHVRIYLSRNNGGSWHLIGVSPAHPGARVFHVPNAPALVCNHARIRIVAQGHPGISRTSGQFRIHP